jgi:hypothetical protein
VFINIEYLSLPVSNLRIMTSVIKKIRCISDYTSGSRTQSNR